MDAGLQQLAGTVVGDQLSHLVSCSCIVNMVNLIK